jgi:hypothetical protein
MKAIKAITLATLLTAVTALPALADIGSKIKGYFNVGTKPGTELVRTGLSFGDVSLKTSFQPGETDQEDFKGYIQHPMAFGTTGYARFQGGDEEANGRMFETGLDMTVAGQYILPAWVRFEADPESGDISPDSFFAMAEGNFPGPLDQEIMAKELLGNHS